MKSLPKKGELNSKPWHSFSPRLVRALFLCLLQNGSSTTRLLPPALLHSPITGQTGNSPLQMLPLVFLTPVCKFSLLHLRKMRAGAPVSEQPPAAPRWQAQLGSVQLQLPGAQRALVRPRAISIALAWLSPAAISCQGVCFPSICFRLRLPLGQRDNQEITRGQSSRGSCGSEERVLNSPQVPL